MNHDLNDTLVFLKVVEAGSFIAAARALRLPKTTVSRKVQNLELRLGAQLLHRTTRKLGLTEAGYVYYENCQRIARELEEAESAVAQLQGGPRGWLRITAPYSLGIERLAPLLGEFRARHPELKVEMLLSNESLDLIDRELDVALRIGDLPDSGLVARPLARLRTGVFASPSYIKRYGEPRHPEELVGHRALGREQPQRAARRHDGGRDLRPPLPRGAAHPAQLGLPRARARGDPGGFDPRPTRGKGGRRRQRRDLAARRGRAPRRPRRGWGEPGHHEQPDLRQRRLRLLRDHRGRRVRHRGEAAPPDAGMGEAARVGDIQ